jgi:hypothetical protein
VPRSSMRGVEVKHIRRQDVDLEKVWDTGDGMTRPASGSFR